MKSDAFALFRAEPYRLLFPAGVVWSFFGAFHWISVWLGWTPPQAGLYHGLLQIAGFGGSFLAGFLMTAIPSFLSAKPADAWELGAAVLLSAAAPVLILLVSIPAGAAAFLSLLILLLVFTARRYRIGGGSPPPFPYIVWGLVHGVAGTLLILFPLDRFYRLGERMLEQGMLLSLVLGIGSFLGARLLGTFQPPGFLGRIAPRTPPVTTMKRIFAVNGLLLFASFWVEAGVSIPAGQWMRVAVAAFQFLAFGRIHRRPAVAFWSARILWLSFWLLATGILATALSPLAYEIAALHIVFIGGFGLMTLVMGLRVVSSHGGVAGLWENARSLMLPIAGMALAGLVLRIAAGLLMGHYFPLLALGAACWIVALAIWAVALVPKMTPKHRE